MSAILDDTLDDLEVYKANRDERTHALPWISTHPPTLREWSPCAAWCSSVLGFVDLAGIENADLLPAHVERLSLDGLRLEDLPSMVGTLLAIARVA